MATTRASNRISDTESCRRCSDNRRLGLQVKKKSKKKQKVLAEPVDEQTPESVFQTRVRKYQISEMVLGFVLAQW